jgi:hypothetical protein
VVAAEVSGEVTVHFPLTSSFWDEKKTAADLAPVGTHTTSASQSLEKIQWSAVWLT